jgi:hypothetical protein
MADDQEFLAALEPSMGSDRDKLSERVKELVSRLSSLTLRPGEDSSSQLLHHSPELAVKKVGGHYGACLEGGWVPPLAIDPSLERLVQGKSLTDEELDFIRRLSTEDARSKGEQAFLRRVARQAKMSWADRTKLLALLSPHPQTGVEKNLIHGLSIEPDVPEEERQYVEKELRNARDLIDAISQRCSIISRVADALVNWQRDFFEKGLGFTIPLEAGQIESALGIPRSVFLCAVANKWIRTPMGIIPLKFLMGTAETR